MSSPASASRFLVVVVVVVGIPLPPPFTCPLLLSSLPGTPVTVHGAALLRVESCRFGGERSLGSTELRHTVAPSRIYNDTLLICTAPGHTVGSVNLSLSYGSVHWRPAGTFQFYEQPVLTALRPASGRGTGATLLRLLGYMHSHACTPGCHHVPPLLRRVVLILRPSRQQTPIFPFLAGTASSIGACPITPSAASAIRAAIRRRR